MVRVSPRLFQRLALLAVVALAFTIVTGGLVRLTGSGLGCPQWPARCLDGRVVPPLRFHAQIEWLNRLTTGAVSVAMLGAFVASLLRAPRRRDLTWLAGALGAGLVAEIVLGGETVKHRLEPGFVMAHFLLSMLLVWDAMVLHHRAGRPDTQSARRRTGPVWIGRLLAAAVAVTVVAGTVVTGAGPHSGANSGDGRVQRWHLDLHRVTQVHGAAAMLTMALVLAAWWRLRDRPADRARLQLVIEALAVQIGIGYTQYFLGVPAWLVAFHILGAVLVWIAVLRFTLMAGSPAPDAVPAAAPAPGRLAPVP